MDAQVTTLRDRRDAGRIFLAVYATMTGAPLLIELIQPDGG